MGIAGVLPGYCRGITGIAVNDNTALVIDFRDHTINDLMIKINNYNTRYIEVVRNSEWQ